MCMLLLKEYEMLDLMSFFFRIPQSLPKRNHQPRERPIESNLYNYRCHDLLRIKPSPCPYDHLMWMYETSRMFVSCSRSTFCVFAGPCASSSSSLSAAPLLVGAGVRGRQRISTAENPRAGCELGYAVLGGSALGPPPPPVRHDPDAGRGVHGAAVPVAFRVNQDGLRLPSRPWSGEFPPWQHQLCWAGCLNVELSRTMACQRFVKGTCFN